MEAYPPPPMKKIRPEVFSNGSFPVGTDGPSFIKLNNGFAQEWESFPTNVGSKSKACLKYFSTSGCPYGEGCHFSHYVPGGIGSLGPLQPSSLTGSASATGLRKGSGSHIGPLMPNVLHREKGGAPLGFKTRLCNRFESPEGCSFGAKCNFAHGEHELRKSSAHGEKSYGHGANEEDGSTVRTHVEPTPPGLVTAAATFGAMSTAKVSISSSLAGIIIGKGGINAKGISRATGARIFIRDHESGASLKNVEMEGSLDQIKQASAMVQELLAHKDITPGKPGGLGTHSYKSKLCVNFLQGSCTYGNRCHFAHGEGEIRQRTGPPL